MAIVDEIFDKKSKQKPIKAIVQEHEIIIVDKNRKVIDVVFSLTELKEKYPNIKLEWRR